MKLEDLSFRYAGQEKAALQHVDLKIEKGEFVLLCGCSGCGKTTLTRVLNGLCPAFYPGVLDGRYTFDQTDMTQLSLKEKSLRIGSVFQDPETQFFTTEGFDEMVLAAEQRALRPDVIWERLDELNRLLGLEGLYGESLFAMSSGEKQKTAIASVCMLSPEVLVLDEPSANLDLRSIQRLGEILAELKERGVTIVLSEHRYHYVKESFDRAVYLVDGEIRRVFTRAEITALEDDELFNRGLRSFEAPTLEAVRAPSAESDILCEVRDLSVASGNRFIFERLNLSIPRSKVTAIFGENGRGKTTLLHIIAGLCNPASGQVVFCSQALSKRQRIRASFLVEQGGSNQLFSHTVEREFLIDSPDQSTEDIHSILAELDLLEKKHAHPLALSGGQKQRLLVGVSALSGKKLLLLDEPTSGLDALNMQRVSALLRRNAQRGQSIVIVTHDVEFIKRTADFVIKL